MNDLKPSLVASAVGFVLSLLIGLLSGVHFFVLLLRALLLALVCGGLTFVATKVLQKYLPELFLHDSPTIGQTSEQTVGSHVNIVVDDEVGSTVDTLADDLAEAASLLDGDSIPSSAQGTPIETSFSENSELGFTPQPTTDLANDGTTLDALPDLKGFEDVTETVVGEITSDLVDAGTEDIRKEDTANLDASNVNNMARAIHTILKKETT